MTMNHITINYFMLACVRDCGIFGREERCMHRVSVGKPDLEDLDTGGKIILK